jgi:hypothetical protein
MSKASFALFATKALVVSQSGGPTIDRRERLGFERRIRGCVGAIVCHTRELVLLVNLYNDARLNKNCGTLRMIVMIPHQNHGV